MTLTGRVHDGGPFGLSDGRNGRLYGVDAFALGQSGRSDDDASVPLGALARHFLQRRATPNALAAFTGEQAYGRPVAALSAFGRNVGAETADAGLALPEPKYLKDDLARLESYVDAQRDAIAGERGAYAGTYQLPSEYRHEGAAAPMRARSR